MKIEDLVDELSGGAVAVRRLASPMHRMVYWLVVSSIYAAGIVYYMGLRTDIHMKLMDARFMVEFGAAAATAMLAAAAAFCAGCPGRPVWERFAPLPPLAVWLATLGGGCWQSWVQSGPDGLIVWPDPICVPSILLVGAVPGVLMLWMIRRGAPMAPVSTMALAALAAGALGAAALRLFHTQDASIMVLVWQFGTVVLITLTGAASGRRFLRWPTVRNWSQVR